MSRRPIVALHAASYHRFAAPQRDANSVARKGGSVAREVRKEEVVSLMHTGATAVEVLGQRQYAEMHIAGAINIPLTDLGLGHVDRLEPDQPVIVYCEDYD